MAWITLAALKHPKLMDKSKDIRMIPGLLEDFQNFISWIDQNYQTRCHLQWIYGGIFVENIIMVNGKYTSLMASEEIYKNRNL